MKLKVVFSLYFIIFYGHNLLGQLFYEKVFDNTLFVVTSGYQISGIKSVDFVRSNVSPVLNIYLEEVVSPEWNISIGFEGFYFRTIANRDIRKYSYFYGNLKRRMGSLLIDGVDRKWISYFVLGSGLFDNRYYGRPNICASASLELVYDLHYCQLIFNVKSIIGWDIYQGNEDILNSFNVGLKLPMSAVKHKPTQILTH